MRSVRGGCVANIDWIALPKKRWLASFAMGWATFEPEWSPPIFMSAPAMPSGLRVNCTAEASARYSR